MSARIEYVCTAHPQVNVVGPRITIHDGAWAYCVAHAGDAHRWIRIEPTRPEFVGPVSTFTKVPALAT